MYRKFCHQVENVISEKGQISIFSKKIFVKRLGTSFIILSSIFVHNIQNTSLFSETEGHTKGATPPKSHRCLIIWGGVGMGAGVTSKRTDCPWPKVL